jgi:SAM-dependent methyltransferase
MVVLMEFTGERVVPGSTPDRVLADHLARYRFAAHRVAGLRALDVACGTGYGAQMLASAGAAGVIGVDLSGDAISYARTHFTGAGVRFLVADAVALPLPRSSCDVAVSFETLEHVPDQHAFLSEVARVVRPSGVFICSTPNRPITTNSDSLDAVSTPFHSREFTAAEFLNLLRAHGFRARLWGQRVFPSVCAAPLVRRRLLPWLTRMTGLDLEYRTFMIGLGPWLAPALPGLAARYLIAECRKSS